MTTIIGTWDVTVEGLKGRRTDVYRFVDQGGRIACAIDSSVARDMAGDVAFDGQRLAFAYNETTPIPALFEVHCTVDGNSFSGESKSKYLPAQRIHGVRRA